MRSLLVIPIVLAVAAVAAWFVLGAMHWTPHLRDVIGAAAVCAVSGTAALAPAAMKRRAGIQALFQAGLLGTVMHLLVTLAGGAVMVLGQVAVDRRAFLYLILVFYWVSLVTLVRILARFFREETALAVANQQAKTS